MDERTFDAVAAMLARRGRRRETLAATLAPLVGLGSGQQADAARCARIGGRCGRGRPCCAGRCRGRRCRCARDADCPRPADPCLALVCQLGRCERSTDPPGTPCGGPNLCLTGVCNPPPACAPALTPCLSNDVCCSGQCLGSACACGGLTTPCFADGDCCPSGSLPGNCTAYRCLD